ncbi:MAG: hypothetical protein WAM46_16255, partial [Flavobacterium sp.]
RHANVLLIYINYQYLVPNGTFQLLVCINHNYQKKLNLMTLSYWAQHIRISFFIGVRALDFKRNNSVLNISFVILSEVEGVPIGTWASAQTDKKCE